MTYYNMVKNRAIDRDDNLAIIYSNKLFSYKEMMLAIEHNINFFKDEGVYIGSKVGIILNNKVDILFTIIAINAVGAIAVPIYPKTGRDKMKKILINLEIDYLLVDYEFIDTFCEQLQYNDGLNLLQKSSFIKIKEKKFFNADLNKDIAMILLSSGTTGEPKGIILTNDNILSNIASISAYLNIEESDIVLHMKNMYHSSSIIAEALLSVLNGCTLVLMDKIVTSRNIIKLVEKYSITIIFTVPVLLKELLSYAKRQNEYMSSVKIINFYGAPIDSNTVEELLHHFEKINFIYSYGLTEASPRVSYAERYTLEKKSTSVGKAIDGVNVKILNNEKIVCPMGEIGEIVVQGPGVMKGYYNDDLKTKNVIIDSELYTGDVGYIDEEGDLFVLGRKDNMFTCGGKNIYPEEIEKVLIETGIFKDAYVRKEENERIIAYVEVEDCDVNMIKVLEFCRMNLEDYKIPNCIKIVDSLDRTENGKVKRNTKNIQI